MKVAGLDAIADSYEHYLEIKATQHLKSFRQRRAATPHAAKAEAAVFSWLRALKLNPVVGEVIGTGGADFFCVDNNKGPGMSVEVKSVSSESVQGATGLASLLGDDLGGPYTLMTSKLLQHLAGKTRQVSGSDVARIVVLTSEHVASPLVLDPGAARMLMTGDTVISAPVGRPVHEAGETTNLSNSAFIRFGVDQTIEACRRSISAALLVQLRDSGSSIIGLLHPEPIIEFSPDSLPDVPFLRFRRWPLLDGRLETEWVISSPVPARLYLSNIELKDEELRSI